MTYRIGIIGGDGIGPEVVAEALKCVDATGVGYEPTAFDLGGDRYRRDGEVLPDEDLEAIRKLDAVLLGAVGTPAGPGGGIVERGLLLRLRFELDLYVNHAPVRRGAGRALNDDVDMVVVRENTEGTYAGEGGFLRKGTPHEVATQGSVNTRIGVERCVRYAFDLARSRPRGTSRSCTRRTCSRSPATSGSARSTRSRSSTPTWRPRTTTSTPRASTSCRTRAATTSSSPTTCSATSSPTSAARCRAGSGGRRRRTSTPPGPGRRCSSRCTVRRPTSPAPARPIRAPRSCRPR